MRYPVGHNVDRQAGAQDLTASRLGRNGALPIRRGHDFFHATKSRLARLGPWWVHLFFFAPPGGHMGFFWGDISEYRAVEGPRLGELFALDHERDYFRALSRSRENLRRISLRIFCSHDGVAILHRYVLLPGDQRIHA